MKRRFGPGKILLFVVLGVGAVVIFAEIVMLLWNNVLAAVTNVHTVTFFQALGILVLSKILFGGFRGGWGGGRPYYWKHKLKQKWDSMSPEEREKFKHGWQMRFGPSGPATSEPGQQASES